MLRDTDVVLSCVGILIKMMKVKCIYTFYTYESNQE